MSLLAHTKDERTQSFYEHAKNVAVLAAAFASEFNSEEQAYPMGLLHDVGKCSPAGQKRLQGDEIRVEHAAAGAEVFDDAAKAQQNSFLKLLAYCVAGHHTGLPDGGVSTDTADMPTLQGKLKRQRKRNYDYAPYQEELKEPVPEAPVIKLTCVPEHCGFCYSFWTRMLFSCLVDADFLDTEAFMNDAPLRRGPGEPPAALLERLEKTLSAFPAPGDVPAGKRLVAEKRKEVLENCRRAAELPRGLFTLTVPTGGGKTLSSLAFALGHAKRNEMRRVIYVIPYTSIIEQTAAVFRGALGEENVLEHHHSVEYDARGGEETNAHILATENWDAPVVVTTNVQFFESLFANRTSRCRKLHNIANSVIIFDEAQMLPVDLLQPCIRAIEELVRNHRCSAVLCSATQPALRPLFDPAVPMREICADPPALYDALRRVRFQPIGQITDEELLERLGAQRQALCIVNTKVQAQALYKGLRGDGNFHLSTLMTPVLRKKTLAQIRERLAGGLPCRVISTSLIEAGVDVDFPCVYREEAGLDSAVQAAGRCNREGGRPADEAVVCLFRPDAQYQKKRPSSLGQPISVARIVAERYDDIASPEAIHEYFSRLFAIKGDALDKKQIVPMLDGCMRTGLSIRFAQVAGLFRVIDSPTQGVLIPEDEEAETIVAALRNGARSRELLRRAGMHTVAVYKRQFELLLGAGAIEMLDEELAVLRDGSLYSKETGLQIPGDGIGVFV